MKIIFAILMGLIVYLIIGFPFYLIIIGFYYAATSHFILGSSIVIIGCLILRLMKPISILTGKDYKIF